MTDAPKQHVWISEGYSLPAEGLCMKRHTPSERGARSKGACCKAAGHEGGHFFRPVEVKDHPAARRPGA